MVMLSPRPVCCTYTLSTTHSSISSTTEPQVPENQDALHKHSPYSQKSRLPLSHGKGLVFIPHGMAGQETYMSTCYAGCVHTCVHVHGYSVCEVSRNECVYVWYVCGCASVMRIL